MIMPWNEKTDRRILWQKSLQFNYSNRYASLLFPALLLFFEVQCGISNRIFRKWQWTTVWHKSTHLEYKETHFGLKSPRFAHKSPRSAHKSTHFAHRSTHFAHKSPRSVHRSTILLANRPILLTNRPKNDTIPVTIIAIRRIILCCFSIAIDYRLTIRHRQRINHANGVSIFQSTFFFAKT